MDKVIIRKMRLGDQIDLKNNIFTEMDITEIEKNVNNNVEYMKNNNDWVYLVAELNNKVVGTTYIKLGTSSLEKHIATLFSVVVSKDYRQKGICKALIDESIEIIKEKNIEKLVLKVRAGTAADTVYKRLGFKEYGLLENGIKDNNKYFNEKYYYLKIK
jgi:ribosomal protein S18 acetylase RimI-like enzyme